MSLITPFQLLELNVISAQDLAPVSRSMRTYAVAWVHPTRKLSTRIDSHGHINPTWNDKFVFRVDESFLRADTSAVMVEIYAVHWFKDVHVGTVRIIVGNLVPPPVRPHHHQHLLGMRFVALQVRRSSGRPQGILNIGVALLDSSMRSMPLYRQLSTSAVGYRRLMGEDTHRRSSDHNNENNDSVNNNQQVVVVKPILRRSQSERSERKLPVDEDLSQKESSIVSGSDQQKGKRTRSKASSLINNASDAGPPQKGKKGTRSRTGSVTNGSELGEPPKKKDRNGKPSSLINGAEPGDRSKKKEKNGKPSSIINGSDPVNPPKVDPPKGKVTIEQPPASKFTGLELGSVQKGVVINDNPFSKTHGYELVSVPKSNLVSKSIWSESDVGPSPSEVAAVVAAEGTNSAVEGWSLDGSVEGLRSKLERWRTELPPLYDRGDYGSFRSTSAHARRHSDGGGLFSCFGNVYGYECSCICGKPASQKKIGSGRVPLSPSIDSMNRYT
ncbi:hypothetical protein L1049_016476 [Liquidambar formosana]|uniref:C2 domain-containing protein n=1 Tax=Liquidambar formosana TaxID=63359 RepID=A0AAP0S592_LIQFO